MGDKHGILLISGRRTHQEGHAAAFAAHPDCELIAVADESDVPDARHQANRQLADDYGIPYIADLDEALALPDVDIVSSCADVERRGRVAVKCAKANKHLYLDKPLAGTVADAIAIRDAVIDSGVTAQMFSNVHASWAQAAKGALESGSLGDLISVHAECVFAKGRAGTVPHGTVRREKADPDRFTFVEAKREMFDIGVYAIGLIRWLSGAEATSVWCKTGNYFFAEHASVDVEDFGTMLMELEGGVTASIAAGRFGWMSHPASGPLNVTLVGTKSTMTFDAQSPKIEVYNSDPNFVLPEPHPLDPMGMWASTQHESGVMPKKNWVPTRNDPPGQIADVTAFIDCIENGKEPGMNVRLAAPLTEIILAGYASAERGEWVRL